MSEGILQVVRKKLRARMNDVTDMLATGHAADYAAYREMCGLIRGLAEAEREILDLEERLRRDQDE